MCDCSICLNQSVQSEILDPLTIFETCTCERNVSRIVSDPYIITQSMEIDERMHSYIRRLKQEELQNQYAVEINHYLTHTYQLEGPIFIEDCYYCYRDREFKKAHYKMKDDNKI